MNHKLYSGLLARHLYPVLRAAGFAGSGATLRRILLPVVHVFNVQASSSGLHCYVNLGAHLTFLPPEGGQVVPPEELTESHCAFRQRLGSNWPYGRTTEQAEEAVTELVSAWQNFGESYFSPYSAFPGTFDTLVQEATLDQVPPKQGLTLARIALELGKRDRAAELAGASLARTPAVASGLRYSLKQVLHATSAP